MTSNLTCQITSVDFFHAPKIFSFFTPQKSFNIPFEFLLYKTNRLHFSVCVYCNRSQNTSQRVKNNSHATRLFVLYMHAEKLNSQTISMYFLAKNVLEIDEKPGNIFNL